MAQPKSEGESRAAGRGGIAITFAKIYFILQGLVQQIVLPRVLGLDGYGALSSVLSASSITYNPIVTASIQGVSRSVAQAGPAGEGATVRRALVIHGLLSVLAASAFFAAAPSIAAFMHAPHITAPLELASLVLFFYGIYSPLIGVLNGRRRFVAQATFDIVFATLRTFALIAGGLWLRGSGRGVTGSVLGFVIAAGVIFVSALSIVGIGKSGSGGPSAREHAVFLGPLFLGQVLLNLLLQADLTLLRRFAGEAAGAVGLPPSAADPLVGAYRATQLFSFLPYQLLVSVTFVLFPMLAIAHRDGDRVSAKKYVQTGVRIALLLSGLLVSVTSGLSGALLRFVYSPEVAELGARSMQILTLGFGAFAILGVLTAVLSSLDRERAGALVVFLAFALVVSLCFGLVRGVAFGSEILVRTALSTSTGLVLATAAAAVLVRRTAGGVVSGSTALRVLASLGATIAVARALPSGGRILTLFESALVAVVYLALLVVTRELGRADVETLVGVLRKAPRA